MINRKLLLVAKITFVLAFGVLVILHKMRSARVLIIHSYHSEYSWVKEESEGLNRFFGKHPEVTLRWHYMDLKNHRDKDFQRAATTIVINTIEKWKPDVMIIFDDIAQELVGTKYVNHPSIKLVFSGVNNVPEKYHYADAKNVTGILERKPLKAVDDAINMLWKGGGSGKKPRAVLIGDKSFDFAAGLFEYTPEHYSWKHVQWVNPLFADTFEEWKQMVLRVATVADFILISDYSQLRKEAGSKEFVSPAEVMKWTERNAKIPVLGLTTAATQDGAMMGVAAAGYEQGLIAAQMAFAIANGKPPSDIPIVSGQQSMVSIRKSGLERRGFEPPSIYEAFARAIDLHYE